MQKISGMNRKEFLGWLGKSLLGASGLLSFLGLGRYLSFRPDPPPQTRFDLGPASHYPAGSRTFLPQAQAVLLVTSSGYTALSLVCPHLGCILQLEGEVFACPCHGSRFKAHGGLMNGPAQQPMRQLRVDLTPDQRLVLDTGSN